MNQVLSYIFLLRLAKNGFLPDCLIVYTILHILFVLLGREERHAIRVGRKQKPDKRADPPYFFEYAAKVWNDEKRLVDFDDEHSTDDELRWHVVGLVDRVIVVVYVEKDADLVRLISARKATREECDDYYRNYESR